MLIPAQLVAVLDEFYELGERPGWPTKKKSADPGHITIATANRHRMAGRYYAAVRFRDWGPLTMDPDDVAPVVFLSYASPERAQARQVRAALEQRGINVLMDVDFEPGQDVLISIGHAINSGVFLPLISTAYLDRPFTQLEVSAAVMLGQDSMFLPVLIESHPAPATDKGRNLWTILNGRTYLLAEMTDKSFDELARQVRRKAGRREQRVVQLPDPMNTSQLSIALIYDWEDGHLTDGIARQCAHAGLTVVEMVAAGTPEAMRQAPPEAHIAVPWTMAAQGSPEVAETVISALAAQRKLLYLLLPDSPPCPDGAAFMRLESLGDIPGRSERPASRWPETAWCYGPSSPTLSG